MSACGSKRHCNDMSEVEVKADSKVECARDGGQFASWELTGAAGLSEDESHGQAPHP